MTEVEALEAELCRMDLCAYGVNFCNEKYGQEVTAAGLVSLGVALSSLSRPDEHEFLSAVRSIFRAHCEAR